MMMGMTSRGPHRMEQPGWHLPPQQSMLHRHHRMIEYAPALNGHRIQKMEGRTSHRHKSKEERMEPHTIDVIGDGPETTICGHIDLLIRLPLHHDMHRQLLETFQKKPGNYEGKYNDSGQSKATVVNYGNGYLAIYFTDDITRPEMSNFLIRYDWKMMSAHCSTQNGKEVIYEKWTNVLDKLSKGARSRSKSRPRQSGLVPRRYL